MPISPSSRYALPRRQRGAALILITIAAVALIGMAGLALDMGLAFATKSRLQNALDAAALSGAKVLNDFKSTSLATDAAEADFRSNMGDDELELQIQFSPTLQPFTPGGANPRYVRVAYTELPVAMRLARVLPGVGDTLDVAGSAVAGPSPLGGRICGAIPVALCGTGTDTDCSDGSCFGYSTNINQDLTIKGGDKKIEAGNYGLVELTCGSGASCIRKGMAGGENFCFEDGGTVTTEPGVSGGPVSQGLNTRFGIFSGPTKGEEARYPPDVVTATGIYYDGYLDRLENGPYNYPEPQGRPQRRVVLIPVMDCTDKISGRKEVALLGSMCLFLTRPSNNQGDVFGQPVPTCEASGSTPGEPDPNSNVYKIILFRDFASIES